MNVCIVGAGAVGGLIGARLAAAGQCEVSALARGATLAALRQHGWRLWQDGVLTQVATRAADRAAALGVQDVVVLAVKTPALPELAPQLAALLGPETVVMPAMNGVPWWFSHGVTALGGGPLESVDPGGVVSHALPLSHVVACVVHASVASPEPGLVRHAMGRGLIVGEAQGGHSARLARLATLLGDAGFEVTASPRIRQDIWYKLWGNMTMNPISALTGATIDRVLDDPLTRAFCTTAMQEAALIGSLIDCAIDQTAEDRHAITRKLGAFRTSMLQDVEAGRAIELDSLVTVVHEMGRRLGVPTPSIDALLGLARLFGRVHGLYPEALTANSPRPAD